MLKRSWRISPADILGDRRIRLRVLGEITLRVGADESVQSRVKGHRDRKAGEVHLLAFCRQITDNSDPLADELPVGHALCAGELHGLRASVRHKGD